MESVDEICARMKRQEEIHCPYCNTLQSHDDGNYPVTYWAEDGPTEMTCEHCDKTFWAEERVSRTYGVGKTKEEASDAVAGENGSEEDDG